MDRRYSPGTNEVNRTNILAPGLRSPEHFQGTHLLPAFTAPNAFGERLAMGSCIQLQQRNCSRFARDFLHRFTV
jgi:hypothetical protein